MLKYFAFVPAVAWLPVICEPWIETGVIHFILAAVAIGAAHLALRSDIAGIIREHCNMAGLEDGEEGFPMKLGLRYLRHQRSRVFVRPTGLLPESLSASVREY